MNEISARCGCKFTFCVNKGALIRWADGSKQNVWRNSSNPRAENIWGKRHPPDIRAEDTAKPSTPVIPEAEEPGNLKRKASTDVPLDPEVTATTSLGGALAEDPHVRHGNDFGLHLIAQANPDLAPQNDTHVQQGYGTQPQMMAGAYLDMTLTQDPRLEESYEFGEEMERTRGRNHFIVNESHDYSSLNEAWHNDFLDEWIAENLHDTDLTDADPQNYEPHMRGGGDDPERGTTGRQRRKKDSGTRWRTLLGLYNHPSNSREILVVEEPSEDEEPYIIQGRAAGGRFFASDQTSGTNILPTSSNENYQVGSHPQSTMAQDDTSTGSNSPLGSVESHLTHPRPSEGWPPCSEEEVDRLNQSTPGQRRIEPSKIWMRNGKPVRRNVRLHPGAERPSTGPTSRQRETARTTHQTRAPAARHRDTQMEAPRGGYPFYRTGSFERRRPLRQDGLLVPLHQFRRPLGRRSRDRESHRNDRIIPLPWLRRSRVAYITGFASFLLVLILMNSVSWPQLLLIFIIAFTAVWLMED
ncbi:hypothetical protein MMC17_004523 [Xylographa soralifera]|nr:hypothetical protein [Xylographa soralifera]